MSHTIAIRDNATQEIRLYRAEEEWEDIDLWVWQDGNFSCDCNRYLSFERAAGNDPNWAEVECSDGKYTALYAELPDGTRVQIDENA